MKKTAEVEQKKLFGTDGIRGLANRFPMSAEMALAVGKAIGLYFKRHYPHPKVIIGKDTRRSGYMLEQALGSGICSVGVDTLFLGPLPTPGIAYLTRGLRACAGIVISASHNPFEDNGIKIFSKTGYKLDDSVELELERLVYSECLGGSETNATLPIGMELGSAKRIDDALGQYAVYLKEQFPKHQTLDGLRIVLDCANGAAYKLAPKVFEELGAEIFVIGNQPDGSNINKDCGALHPQGLQQKVKLYKADVGFAFDGDADRIICVDHRGEILDGDEILAICGLYYKKTGQLTGDAVVSTVMSNLGLEQCLNKNGIELIRAKVGDRYVMEAMQARDVMLGGEQSGHLIFRSSATTGDGVLAALHLLEVSLAEKKTIHELKKVMKKIPQVLKNVKVTNKVPLEKMPNLKKKIDEYQTQLGTKGRILFRYSGTENKGRIMIEGEKATQINSMATQLEEILITETMR